MNIQEKLLLKRLCFLTILLSFTLIRPTSAQDDCIIQVTDFLNQTPAMIGLAEVRYIYEEDTNAVLVKNTSLNRFKVDESLDSLCNIVCEPFLRFTELLNNRPMAVTKQRVDRIFKDANNKAVILIAGVPGGFTTSEIYDTIVVRAVACNIPIDPDLTYTTTDSTITISSPTDSIVLHLRQGIFADQDTIKADTTFLAARSSVDSLPTGSGLAERVAVWETDSTLTYGGLIDDGSVLQIDSRTLRLWERTTATLPTPSLGDLVFSTTGNNIGFYGGTAWEYPVKGATTNGLLTANTYARADANGRLTNGAFVQFGNSIYVVNDAFSANNLTFLNSSTYGELAINTAGSSARRGFNLNGFGTSGLIQFNLSDGVYFSPQNIVTTGGRLIGFFQFNTRRGGSLSQDNAYFGAAITGTTTTSSAPTSIFFTVGGSNANYTPLVTYHHAQKVGIGNFGAIFPYSLTEPARLLDVNGEVRIRDLTTDTPTRVVGADADGDLGEITYQTLIDSLNANGLTGDTVWLATELPLDTVRIDANQNPLEITDARLSLTGIGTSTTLELREGTGQSGNHLVWYDESGNIQGRIDDTGNIRNAAGNRFAPGYTFHDDTDTGMFLDSDGKLAFAAGSNQPLFIYDNSTVGIGAETSGELSTLGIYASGSLDLIRAYAGTDTVFHLKQNGDLQLGKYGLGNKRATQAEILAGEIALFKDGTGEVKEVHPDSLKAVINDGNGIYSGSDSIPNTVYAEAGNPDSEDVRFHIGYFPQFPDITYGTENSSGFFYSPNYWGESGIIMGSDEGTYGNLSVTKNNAGLYAQINSGFGTHTYYQNALNNGFYSKQIRDTLDVSGEVTMHSEAIFSYENPSDSTSNKKGFFRKIYNDSFSKDYFTGFGKFNTSMSYARSPLTHQALQNTPPDVPDYSFFIQSRSTAIDAYTHFQVDLLDESADFIKLYNNAYTWKNGNPSYTLNDTTIHAWIGTGSAATPIFLPYSLSGGTGGSGDGYFPDTLAVQDVAINNDGHELLLGHENGSGVHYYDLTLGFPGDYSTVTNYNYSTPRLKLYGDNPEFDVAHHIDDRSIGLKKLVSGQGFLTHGMEYNSAKTGFRPQAGSTYQSVVGLDALNGGKVFVSIAPVEDTTFTPATEHLITTFNSDSTITNHGYGTGNQDVSASFSRVAVHDENNDLKDVPFEQLADSLINPYSITVLQTTADTILSLDNRLVKNLQIASGGAFANNMSMQGDSLIVIPHAGVWHISVTASAYNETYTSSFGESADILDDSLNPLLGSFDYYIEVYPSDNNLISYSRSFDIKTTGEKKIGFGISVIGSDVVINNLQISVHKIR